MLKLTHINKHFAVGVSSTFYQHADKTNEYHPYIVEPALLNSPIGACSRDRTNCRMKARSTAWCGGKKATVVRIQNTSHHAHWKDERLSAVPPMIWRSILSKLQVKQKLSMFNLQPIETMYSSLPQLSGPCKLFW